MTDEQVAQVMDLLDAWNPPDGRVLDERALESKRQNAEVQKTRLEKQAFRIIIQKAWDGDVSAIRYLEDKGFIQLPTGGNK